MKKPTEKEMPEGLRQSFKGADNKKHILGKVLNENDWWETKGRNKLVLLKHDAVKKIAKLAGYSVVKYDILTQPTIYNNMECVLQVEMVDKKGNRLEPELGEANRSNLGSKGKNNPMNMAQKRSFDRTVLFNLGITGILSDEEIPQEDEEQKMEQLTHDERKEIAPLLNSLLAAKTKDHLSFFGETMKQAKLALNEKQLEYLRKLYKKRYGEVVAKESF